MTAQRFFDAIARRYDRVYARGSEEMREHMTRVLAWLGGPCDVLDLGIGTGPELPYLLDARHRVTGIDVSPAMLALFARRSRTAPFIRADFWSGLPVASASFDAIIALFGTLSHPPDEASLPKLAADIARVLRPGGLFYAEVPTEAWVTAHPRFVDEASGASIEIHALGPTQWRDAFVGFEVRCDERGDELAVRLRSPLSPAAR